MTDLLVRLFVKNYKDVKNNTVRQDYGTLGGIVGIICNLILCTVKIIVGLITGSISIVADGLNNLSDMGSSVITMIGFKLAGKPADSDHPYGHGRMEYMSAFIVAILILLVGVELFKSSFNALITGQDAPQYSYIALAILAFSVIMKFWMFIFNRKIGKRTESSALLATSQDCLNDMITTTVILIAAAVSLFVNIPFNLDAVLGIFVALFILWSGFSTAKDTLNSILGGAPAPELISDIEQTVMSFEEFIGVHDLIIHNYGPGRQFASVHVEVPQNIDIVHCHEQIDLCEKLVQEQIGVSLVIHMDPIDVDNEAVSNARQLLSESIKIIDERLTLHDFRMTPAGQQRTNLIFDVVLPAGLKANYDELNEKINQLAKLINPTYCCVITFDQDFSGK